MSSHNYSYQYRSLFGGVSFDDVLQCEYIIVVAECYRDFGANFCRAVDTVKQRMQLPMVVRVYFLSSL